MNLLDAVVTKIISVEIYVNTEIETSFISAKVEYNCWGSKSETTILVPFDEKLEVGYKFQC